MILTAANVAPEQLDEARMTAERIMRLEPQFSLSEFANTQPYRDPQHLERLIERLRKAGLHE